MRRHTIMAMAAVILAAALQGCSQYALVNSDVYNNADLADYHTFRIVTPSEGSLPGAMQMVTYYNIAAAIREQMVERGYTEDPNSPILINIGLTVKKESSLQAIPTAGQWVTPPPVPVPPPPGGPGAPHPGPGEPAPGLPETPPQGGPGLALPAGGPLHRLPPERPEPGPEYKGMAPVFIYPRSYYIPGPTQIVQSIYREGVLTMDIVDMATKTPLYSSSVATILDNGDTQFRNLEGIAQAVDVLFSRFPVPVLPQYKR